MSVRGTFSGGLMRARGRLTLPVSERAGACLSLGGTVFSGFLHGFGAARLDTLPVGEPLQPMSTGAPGRGRPPGVFAVAPIHPAGSAPLLRSPDGPRARPVLDGCPDAGFALASRRFRRPRRVPGAGRAGPRPAPHRLERP